ncbi:MAG: SPOR domain-containing protein [Acidobacteria bacterium]|nr:SPOR domain-containing protein [Acidobacteriota bacterium]
MKVICPKCQYENEVDTRRVVCSRCATIIEVRIDQAMGQDSNGKRQTAGLPFASQGGDSQASHSQPLDQPHDLYATRIGDDLDDVLDIPPRSSQASFQSNYEPSQVYDDVFATPGYDQSPSYDYSMSERRSSAPLNSYQTSTPSRAGQDYADSNDMEYMGWPMLPENAIEDEEEGNNDSGSSDPKIVSSLAITLVFVGLVLGSYYFFGDFINKRKDQFAAGVQQPENQAANPDSGSADAKATDQTSAQDSGSSPKPADESTAGSKEVAVPPVADSGGSAPQPAEPTRSISNSNAISIPNSGNYTIQVGSYKDQGEANDRVNSLKSSGIEARVVRAEIPGRGTYNRVQIGRCATVEQCESVAGQLRTKGVQDYIVTSINQ